MHIFHFAACGVAALVLTGCHLRARHAEDTLPAVHQESYGSPYAYQHKIEAELFYYRGDYANAAQAIQNAIAADNKDANLHAGYGRILLAQNALVNASHELNKALLLDPGNVEARLLLAAYYIAKENIPMAMEQVRTAHSYDRTGIRTLIWLAAYLSPTDPAQAARYYKDAIAMAPNHLELYLKLGSLLCRQNHPHAAAYYLGIYDKQRQAITATTCNTLSR